MFSKSRTTRIQERDVVKGLQVKKKIDKVLSNIYDKYLKILEFHNLLAFGALKEIRFHKPAPIIPIFLCGDIIRHLTLGHIGIRFIHCFFITD